MRIAIIGSGNVGSALAAAATKAGHDVTLSASEAESAREAAGKVGARAADSNADAVRDAEIVPWTADWIKHRLIGCQETEPVGPAMIIWRAVPIRDC